VEAQRLKCSWFLGHREIMTARTFAAEKGEIIA